MTSDTPSKNALPESLKRDSRRLSWAYFGYFGVLALIVPYLAVYLDALSFNSREIGELIAIATLCRIIGPPVWAMICDRSQQRLPAIRTGVFATLLLLLVMNYATSYLAVAAVLALISLFWSAILPQLEVVTLTTLGVHSNRYSRIRAGGSVGFVVVALIAAELMSVAGRTSFPWLAAVLLVPLAIAVMRLREPPPMKTAESHVEIDSLWRNIRRRPFICFLLSSILLQLSFAPFYAFFALYLTQLGYAPFSVGAMIALGVVAEVGMFLIAGRLVGRFRISRLLAFCMLVTAFRWALLAEFANIFWMLIFVQLLHAFSFALHHSTAMAFLHRHFPQAQHGRGQAIYVSVGFGGGAALGALVAGMIWLDGAGASTTFWWAATASLIGAVIALGVAQERGARPSTQ
ncbi:MAG: MFS transporter [Idiomarina sp.]|nr:MFS transporter [Idiomarina sp.]